MSTESDNFEALRKLLVLKKHEVPPPGYFDQFASEIRSRLAAGEHRQTDLWREMGDEASWLQRLWSSLAAQPALAGAVGMAVCGVMLAGVYFSQSSESGNGGVTVAESWKLTAPAVSALAGGQMSPATMLASSSTNPVMAVPAGGSLFDRIGVAGQTAPVSFELKP